MKKLIILDADGMLFFSSRTLICRLSGWPPTKPSQTNCGMLANLYCRTCLMRMILLLGKKYCLIR